MIVKVLNNQSLFDLATQFTGKASNAFSIAEVNNISITDSLIAGSEITIPDDIIKDDHILAYYTHNNLIAGTALTDDQIEELNGCDGIGCWMIGYDFIIS